MTPPRKRPAKRAPAKARKTSVRRIDWPTIRAAYVEGQAIDPQGDPNARSWPTLDELAVIHGVSKQAVVNHSAGEGWVDAREEFQREVERRRREQVIAEQAARTATIDRRGLAVAEGITTLLQTRVEALVRKEVDARREDPANVGTTINAAELTAIGLAGRRALQMKDQVMGRKVDAEEEDRLQEADVERGERVLAEAIKAHRAARVEDSEDV